MTRPSASARWTASFRVAPSPPATSADTDWPRASSSVSRQQALGGRIDRRDGSVAVGGDDAVGDRRQRHQRPLPLGRRRQLSLLEARHVVRAPPPRSAHAVAARTGAVVDGGMQRGCRSAALVDQVLGPVRLFVHDGARQRQVFGLDPFAVGIDEVVAVVVAVAVDLLEPAPEQRFGDVVLVGQLARRGFGQHHAGRHLLEDIGEAGAFLLELFDQLPALRSARLRLSTATHTPRYTGAVHRCRHTTWRAGRTSNSCRPRAAGERRSRARSGRRWRAPPAAARRAVRGRPGGRTRSSNRRRSRSPRHCRSRAVRAAAATP